MKLKGLKKEEWAEIITFFSLSPVNVDIWHKVGEGPWAKHNDFKQQQNKFHCTTMLNVYCLIMC